MASAAPADARKDGLTLSPGPVLDISAKCKVCGALSSTGVVNFLGIPFATIPARFRQSKLLNLEDACNSGILDATRYGPICPQPYDPLISRRMYLYEGLVPLLEVEGMPVMDLEECLRVNVFVPPGALHGRTAKLPVYANIHGGGWTTGNGNTSSDGNYSVQHAMKIGKPFVSVGINYRLGYHGFLGSKDLEEEARQNGEVYSPNRGLWDQRIALLWIRKHIHHFGGDPDQITIAGESAGAFSSFAHGLSDIPVCKRIIIQSAPVWKFADPALAEETYQRLVSSTGIPTSASATERLAALRQLSDKQLEDLLGGSFARPVWDPNWFVHQDVITPFERVTKFSPWVEGVLVGWTRDEMALWSNQWHSLTSAEVEAWVRDVSPDPAFASELLKAYNVSRDNPAEISLDGLMRLSSDGAFGCLPIMLGRLTSPAISVFRFEQTDDNPQSSFKGRSYHSLDTAFVLRTPAVAGPEAEEKYRTTADAMAEDWAAFIYGSQPFEQFQKSGKVRLYNSHGNELVDWASDKTSLMHGFIDTEQRAEWFSEVGKQILSGKNELSNSPTKPKNCKTVA
ncbi:hypothetical protein LTS17_009379 [Exophiala oligosperma]